MTDAAVRAAQRAAGQPTGAASAPPPREQVVFIGIVTRGVALVVDAVIVNVVAVVTGAAVALLMTTLSVPSEVETVAAFAAGGAYALWVAVYFTAFWAVNAQTPGGRVMGFRVQHPDGRRMRPRRALLRFAAMVVCAIPLGAGFVPVLFDARRRGLHDRLARTVVVAGEGDRPHEPHGVEADGGPGQRA